MVEVGEGSCEVTQTALACLTAALLNRVSKGLSHCQHSSMEPPPALLPTENLSQLTSNTERKLSCPSEVEKMKKLAVWWRCKGHIYLYICCIYIERGKHSFHFITGSEL